MIANKNAISYMQLLGATSFAQVSVMARWPLGCGYMFFNTSMKSFTELTRPLILFLLFVFF